VDVVRRVENPVSRPAGAHEAGQAELGKVLGDSGGLGADVAGQLSHGMLSVEQGPEEAQPGAIAEKLEGPDGDVDLVHRRQIRVRR